MPHTHRCALAVQKSEKTEFLAYFYRKSMRILLAPLLANTSSGRILRGEQCVSA